VGHASQIIDVLAMEPWAERVVTRARV
jgi:hypothetical protein